MRQQTLLSAWDPVNIIYEFSTCITRCPSRTKYAPMPTARHVTSDIVTTWTITLNYFAMETLHFKTWSEKVVYMLLVETSPHHMRTMFRLQSHRFLSNTAVRSPRPSRWCPQFCTATPRCTPCVTRSLGYARSTGTKSYNITRSFPTASYFFFYWFCLIFNKKEKKKLIVISYLFIVVWSQVEVLETLKKCCTY